MNPQEKCDAFEEIVDCLGDAEEVLRHFIDDAGADPALLALQEKLDALRDEFLAHLLTLESKL